MATPIQTKLNEFKAMFGLPVAQEVLDAAEAKEKAAKEAGVQSKERKTTTKADEEDHVLALSEVLATLETAFNEGKIEDDLGLFEDEQEDPGDEQPETEDGEGTDDVPVLAEALVKEFGRQLDVRFKEHDKALDAKFESFRKSFVPRGKEVGEQMTAAKEEQAKTKARMEELQAELDELNGLQPRKIRTKGFRASESASNLTEKEVGGESDENPIDTFIQNLIMPGGSF